ncbi:Uncharacterized conserved protein YbjT, contains NAD(P)-binding and DUF2867 domains [Izhakiella capsodis]|uniref:Uncharacterized conserved protein YbjT, contains NAD(P)-binding and DUF2867 domains n=1 Tax=Izhakiella capsodis TaxID=1367852 RepID=A0A1I4XAW3_9GAMM|nr:NAD(P)H-binding protein [Izhakiella capsodis]SFN22925.1 Uncharacterized conserved protein YbjT, contains NAD(P)-binding and DUF2867 domains [Izhakiella capsodis]
MNSWLIFGAGGTGVGALTAALGLREGRRVIALVRNPDAARRLQQQGIQVIKGDACDPAAVALACQAAGRQALTISTMGGENNFQAHRRVIDSLEQAGVSRMLLVTSLGCGDGWRFLSARAKAAFGAAVREKSLAESWLQTSSLDFAILRPGGLLNGPPTGSAQRYQQQEIHGLVKRADVAVHIHQLAQQSALNGQIYSLIDPQLKAT